MLMQEVDEDDEDQNLIHSQEEITKMKAKASSFIPSAV